MTLRERVKQRRIFFGWWTALISGIICLWGYGLGFYGFGAYFKAIAKDLNLSRAVTSGAAALERLEGGFAGPIVGWAIDKYGPRAMNMFAMFLIGLGFVLMYFVNSLWSYYAVWGMVVSAGLNLGLDIPLGAAIAKWFVKKRGTALTVMRVPIGFSGIIVVPLITWLMGLYGWRIALVIGGVTMWLIGLPLTWFFVRPHRPEYYGLLPDGEESRAGNPSDTAAIIRAGVEYAEEINELEFTVRQALKTHTFWIMVVSHALSAMAGPAITIHLIPFLTDMGVNPMIAATAMGLLVLISIPGRLVGILLDRLPASALRYALVGPPVLESVGLAILISSQKIAAIYLFLIVYGIGYGAQIAVSGPVMGRYFGRKGYATINGAMGFVNMPIGMIAPIYAGWTYDVTSSYMSAYIVVTALLFLSALVIFFATPPKPPAKLTEINDIL